MKILYFLFLELSAGILPVFGAFVPKIRNFLKQREGVLPALRDFRSHHPGPVAWFHVASLGEYEQARPVISSLKSHRPELGVVVSFFSASGYEPAKKKSNPEVDFITYLPLDRKTWANQFVEMLDPKLAIFVKYDLWYHHLSALKRKHVPIYLIAAAFHKNQRYFAWYGDFFQQMLQGMDWIFTQNESSVDLLKSIGYTKSSLAGDTRFDRVNATASNPRSFPEISSWIQGRPTLVVGSAWQEDMNRLIPVINAKPEYLWIIAPHDITSFSMDLWAKELHQSSARFSVWDSSQEVKVLFIDNVGMLASLYQFARVAYVGGGFGKGLHNILEPLGFGIPVLFAKLRRPDKFPEASQSRLVGCGCEIQTSEDLMVELSRMEQPAVYTKACKAAKNWVNSNLGSSEKIVSHLLAKHFTP